MAQNNYKIDKAEQEQVKKVNDMGKPTGFMQARNIHREANVIKERDALISASHAAAVERSKKKAPAPSPKDYERDVTPGPDYPKKAPLTPKKGK